MKCFKLRDFLFVSIVNLLVQFLNETKAFIKGKSKVANFKKRKIQNRFSYTWNLSNFQAFQWNISIEHKPLISEEVSQNISRLHNHANFKKDLYGTKTNFIHKV